jgi:hypothetical protein
MAWRIAEAFVEFSIRNVEAVVKGMDQVKAGLDRVQSGAQVVGRVATAAFAGITASMYGFVHSGLSASNMGTLLSFQFERLSRSMAGLFQPEIRKVIEGISALTGWIERLTPHQKELIARFILGAAAATAVATTLPFLISGISATVGAIRSLVVAVGILEGETGIGALLPLLGAAAAAFTALAIGTEVGRGGIGRFWEAIKPVLTGLQTLATQLVDALSPVGDFLVYVFDTVGQTVLSVVPYVQQAAVVIGRSLAGAFEQLSPIIAGFLPIWSGVVQAVASMLPLWSRMAAGLVSLITPVVAAFLRFALALADMVGRLVQTITTGAQQLAPFVDAITELAASLGDVLGAALESLGGQLVEIVGLLVPVIELFAQMARVVLTVATPAIHLLAEALHEVASWLHVIGGISAPEIKVPKFAPFKDQNREQIARRTGPFENIEQTYRRIAEASVKVGAGKTDAQKQTEQLEKANEHLEGIEEAVKGNKVPIR